MPESWRKFFDGLSDDEKLIYDNLRGPSWSPEKNIRKPLKKPQEKRIVEEENNKFKLSICKTSIKRLCKSNNAYQSL